MEKTELYVGDVVQIDPSVADCLFKGAFMIVTEPKSWGAQGFIACDFKRDGMPGRAYFRATWEHMEYVGKAPWVPEDDIEAAHEG